MNSLHQPPVIVVGAGMGGLACALDLAARGVDVLVFERQAAPGGKLREVAVGSQRLDAGPTVFTMRWVFDELFAAAGERLESHLGLRAATTLARHAWPGGESLDLYTDVDRTADAIEAFAGRADAAGYRAFSARAQAIYQTLEVPYLRGDRPTPLSLSLRVAQEGLAGLTRIAPFATLWRALGHYFRDPRLRQLFGRYATYCGSSPFDAPATLMLVAHVERAGLWTVDGGMHRVALALATLASARGARLRYGATVDEIVLRGGRACGVRLHGGEFFEATAVVFNGDAEALPQGLLGTAARAALPSGERAERSLSAITWNLHADPRGLPLLRHNVFFGADSRREFDQLFRERRVPQDPTVYVCAQDRGSEADAVDPGPPPEARPQRLLCLVNAPAQGPRASPAPSSPLEIEQCQDLMIRQLAACGLALNPDTSTPGVVTLPAEFAARFPGSQGAIYGQASHGWKASFSRPGARCRIPGLYLAGGTTHPGPGLPMAALSGRLAARSLMADWAQDPASTARWPLAAMPGGTSTR